MVQKIFLLIIACMAVFTGCEKDLNGPENSGSVDFYLIHSFSTLENSCQIDENSVILEDTVFIKYSDILKYDSSDYTFKLSDIAIDAIKKLEHSVFGIPFAVTANDTLVYTGYFWPSYSSASCEWMVIDPIMISIGNNVKVRMGYPGLLEGQIIPDKRNDLRLIRIFKRDRKLK